jgi:hypothetical protein
MKTLVLARSIAVNQPPRPRWQLVALVDFLRLMPQKISHKRAARGGTPEVKKMLTIAICMVYTFI